MNSSTKKNLEIKQPEITIVGRKGGQVITKKAEAVSRFLVLKDFDIVDLSASFPGSTTFPEGWIISTWWIREDDMSFLTFEKPSYAAHSTRIQSDELYRIAVRFYDLIEKQPENIKLVYQQSIRQY